MLTLDYLLTAPKHGMELHGVIPVLALFRAVCCMSPRLGTSPGHVAAGAEDTAPSVLLGMQVTDGTLSITSKQPGLAEDPAHFTLGACAASCGRVQELQLMLRRRAPSARRRLLPVP